MLGSVPAVQPVPNEGRATFLQCQQPTFQQPTFQQLGDFLQCQ